jgi:hypothetical protein
VPLLAPYLAGKLRKAQAELVRQHVATCVKCTRKLGGARASPAPEESLSTSMEGS